ncbi:DMT family transporter [Heliobacterium chlorum]|nr:DMT family transporter [Heliobacterium chlorum]
MNNTDKAFLSKKSALQLPIVIANVAMLIAVLFWGLSFISIKEAVAEVPPITLALLRFVIASILLWIVVKISEPGTRLDKSDRIPMLGAGAMGITLYFFFENSGIKLTTASNASLITSVVPVLAIIMDIVIYKTRVSLIQSIAIIASLFGTYLSVTANGQVDFTSDTFLGNLLVLGAMVSWAVYTMQNKSLSSKYSGLYLTMIQTLLGTALLFPLSLLERNEWQPFSYVAFGHILFLAVLCSAACYFLYNYALPKLDVTATTLYLNLIPIVGVIGGYVYLNETIIPIQLIGGAIIIISILLVTWEKTFQKKTRP